ncbi:MAG: transporter [Polyangia bacterium]
MRLGALALLLCASTTAWADGTSTGIAADRLRFGLGPSVLAGAEGAETTRSGNVNMLLSFDYLNRPIQLRSVANGAVVSTPVRHQLVGNLGWEIGLPRRFAIQLSLPVALWNAGDRLRYSGVTGDDATTGLHAGTGDLLLGIKVALLGHPEEPGMHVAFALDGTAPLGGDHDFAATGSLTIAPRLMIDYRLPWFTIVLDAQVRFAGRRTLFGTSFGDELDITGGVVGKLASFRRSHLVAYVEAAGVVASGASTRSAELRGALRLATPHADVDVGAGGGLDDAIATPRYRLFAVVRVPLDRRGK